MRRPEDVSDAMAFRAPQPSVHDQFDVCGLECPRTERNGDRTVIVGSQPAGPTGARALGPVARAVAIRAALSCAGAMFRMGIRKPRFARARQGRDESPQAPEPGEQYQWLRKRRDDPRGSEPASPADSRAEVPPMALGTYDEGRSRPRSSFSAVWETGFGGLADACCGAVVTDSRSTVISQYDA
jgi:hypothetical protein